MDNKYIVVIIMIGLGIGSIFLGFQGVAYTDGCSGINTINPICWISQALNVIVQLLSYIFGAFFILAGVLYLILEDPEQRKWVLPTLIIGGIFVLNIFIPDPIPILDEALFGFVFAVSGLKMISPNTQVQPKLGF